MILDENDYLTFHLFTASKTPRIRNTRIRSWIFTTVTFALLAFLFYRSDNALLGNYFLILSGLSLILFPFYSRWRYKRFYVRHIRDTYKNMFGEQSELEFDKDTIGTKDKNGELKFNKSEIQEINEIRDYYFLRARTGVTLIISKVKTEDIDKIRNEIKSIVDTHGIKHNVELNWKWR